MLVVYTKPDDKDWVYIVLKGAPEAVVAQCFCYFDSKYNSQPLDSKKFINTTVEEMANQGEGLKLIAYAFKKFPARNFYPLI